MEEVKKNTMATAGLVLGIIAVVLSFIPFVGVISIILSILAIIFCGIGLSKVSTLGIGKKSAIVGLILGIVAIVINIVYWLVISAAFVGAVGAAAEAGILQ